MNDFLPCDSDTTVSQLKRMRNCLFDNFDIPPFWPCRFLHLFFTIDRITSPLVRELVLRVQVPSDQKRGSKVKAMLLLPLREIDQTDLQDIDYPQFLLQCMRNSRPFYERIFNTMIDLDSIIERQFSASGNSDRQQLDMYIELHIWCSIWSAYVASFLASRGDRRRISTWRILTH